jgi:NAD(P)-dependent dehydrogenase (short-subunit alcohol dehydrogenase family)
MAGEGSAPGPVRSAAVQLQDKVVVVTGGGNGIGAAMCRRFAAEGAEAVVVADLDADAARGVADEIGGRAVGLDVSDEAQVQELVASTRREHGRIDLFCANAGVGALGGVEVPDEDWQRSWDVNVMAHVYAARALLPEWLAQGEGYLLHTASAAGLLTNIGTAPYTATKHAVVGLAEWLSMTHGGAGVRFSCLCPMGVRTNMVAAGQDASAGAVVISEGLIEPEECADAVVAGLATERFLILPHPEVSEYVRRKADDHDRWLAGMRRLQAAIEQGLQG